MIPRPHTTTKASEPIPALSSPPPILATATWRCLPIEDFDIHLAQRVTRRAAQTIENAAGLLHDGVRSALSYVGFEERVKQRMGSHLRDDGEGGHGLGVMLIGIGDETANSIAIRLARSGYTVFAVLPLPNTMSPHASVSLSSLLVMWSRFQRRIREKHPNHPGEVVPVLTDPHHDDSPYSTAESKPQQHYVHTANTIRAYCHDHNLHLISVIVTAADPTRSTHLLAAEPYSPPPRYVNAKGVTYSIPRTSTSYVYEQPLHLQALGKGFFNQVFDDGFLPLARSNVLEPREMIRHVMDMLIRASNLAYGRSRVILVNGELGLGVLETGDAMRTLGMGERKQGVHLGTRVMQYLISESNTEMKRELSRHGVDVCEVVVGPMLPRRGGSVGHSRHSSDESTASDKSRREAFAEAMNLRAVSPPATPHDRDSNDPDVKEAAMARRFGEWAKGWAVDERLLFRTIRRAVEDRYPRNRYHAGLTPIILTISGYIPGAGIAKRLGRWALRKVFVATHPAPKSKLASSGGWLGGRE